MLQGAVDAGAMARQPRLDLPGIPQHIVQRGNNRLPCFLDDIDRACYRQLLREALLATGCGLHAYVLMDNHVHLLVTPPRAGAIGQLMQRLGRQYVGQFNARHGRTGTLWEGRYKACLVDTTEHLLRCARYIDLNPVRARMTDDPAPGPRPGDRIAGSAQSIGGPCAGRRHARRRSASPTFQATAPRAPRRTQAHRRGDGPASTSRRGTVRSTCAASTPRPLPRLAWRRRNSSLLRCQYRSFWRPVTVTLPAWVIDADGWTRHRNPARRARTHQSTSSQ